MNGFWKDTCCAACLCVTAYLCVFTVCLLYLFQAEHFLLSSRRLGGCEFVTVKKIPRILFRKETCLHALLKGAAHDIIHTHPLSLWPCCCVCCVLCLFLLSPIELPPCVYAHMFVPVFCKHGKLFPHLPWLSSKTLQPSGSHSPTQPLPALPLFQTTLAPSDRVLCVILTCFLSTGAPNSTSGPPWITNALTVGPQTAHCLSYAVFSLRVEAWALQWEPESKLASACVCLLCTDILLLFCVFIF